MNTRNEFGFLLLQNNLTAAGVELGSFEGWFAKQILNTWPGKLYLVDVWRPLPKEEYDDVSNHENHKTAYKETIDNIKGFEDRAFMLRMKGEDAIELFNDNSLDFVYIDANHTYEAVKKDLELWYPKVKHNGIVAGHDYLPLDCYNEENYKKGNKNFPIYMWSNDDPTNSSYVGMFGVNPAVEEFTKEYGYQFNVTDEFAGTWWFTK